MKNNNYIKSKEMTELTGNNYRQRCFDQLSKWVAGESIHNKIENECCPDFSCCKPELKANKAIRQKYMESYRNKDENAKSSMLAEFLGKGLANIGHNVELSSGKKINAKK